MTFTRGKYLIVTPNYGNAIELYCSEEDGIRLLSILKYAKWKIVDTDLKNANTGIKLNCVHFDEIGKIK